MTRNRKIWTLVLLGIAVLAVVLLSANLSDLEFFQGQPFSLREREQSDTQFDGRMSGDQFFDFLLKLLLIIGGVFLLLTIICFIISPEARKRILREAIPLIIFALFYYLFMRNRPEIFNLPVDPAPPEPAPEVSLEAPPIVEFTPDPPWWLSLTTRIGLALLVAALLVGIIWAIWRRRRRQATSLEQLAAEAENALQAIQTGADLRNTVIRCYFDMNRVLQEEQNIRRQRAMTPREFEKHLEEMGIPSEHIHRLTRLFESARYGSGPLSKSEERQAIRCLAAIVDICKDSR